MQSSTLHSERRLRSSRETLTQRLMKLKLQSCFDFATDADVFMFNVSFKSQHLLQQPNDGWYCMAVNVRSQMNVLSIMNFDGLQPQVLLHVSCLADLLRGVCTQQATTVRNDSRQVFVGTLLCQGDQLDPTSARKFGSFFTGTLLWYFSSPFRKYFFILQPPS